MMRNMAGMMKKVQEMQSRMEALQQEMADTNSPPPLAAAQCRSP